MSGVAPDTTWITIIAEGKLDISNPNFHFSGHERETFIANKQEYVFNFLGFDQEKGEGCIRISIHKKCRGTALFDFAQSSEPVELRRAPTLMTF